ncbi:MAG: patatin-like phospholipase family protein [Candidatus Cloacimonadales bacterium]
MKKNFLLLFILFFVLGCYAEELKVGLALSGGGARGLAHIGLLKVIDEVGLEIDYIAGTSFGGLVGAMYSLGYSPAEMEELFLRFDLRHQISDKVERKALFMEEKRWSDYGAINIKIDEDLSLNMPASIISGNNMLKQLAKHLNRGIYYPTFDDFPIPFRCNATNLLTGERVEFKEGNLIDVVRASMAFPTLLEPFDVDGGVYVDGGIKDNLPVQSLLDMGANFVIANKASTPMKPIDQCQDFMSILNQSININMNVWVEEAIAKTDLLIVPSLKEYKNSSFSAIKDLIRLGEEEARKHIPELQRLKALQGKRENNRTVYKFPHRILLNDITVSGNSLIHSSKVKLYSGLETGNYYTLNEVLEATQKCYNTQYFVWVYPKLTYHDGGYSVEIATKERSRSYLGIDATYNSTHDLVARFTVTMNNVVQKNSKLINTLQLGGVNSYIIDYVKNFGNLYGSYYHVFPLIEESRLYNYNFEGRKSNRIKKLEYGLSLGIGFFLKDILVSEGFIYASHYNLYQDVAELELPQEKFKSIGAGFKVYHESVDDLYFPGRGSRMMVKYQHGWDEPYSDEGFEKIYVDLFKAFKINNNFSLQVGVEGGVLKNSKLGILFCPFQMGGIDSFSGLDEHSLNSEAFQINRIGLLYNYKNRYFVNISTQFLYEGSLKVEGGFESFDRIYDVTLGYKTPLGPLRLAVASDFNKTTNYFLSFGFTKDMFKFSRN